MQKELTARQTAGSAGDYVPDWSVLTPGDLVALQKPDGYRVTGAIDVVAPDGTMLWFYEDLGLGRQLVLRTDGLKVWNCGGTTKSMHS